MLIVGVVKYEHIVSSLFVSMVFFEPYSTTSYHHVSGSGSVPI